MKIELTDSEINEGLVSYIESQGIHIEGMDVEVHLTAGRGTNGNSATINITKRDDEAAATSSSEETREEAQETSETTDDDLIVFGSE